MLAPILPLPAPSSPPTSNTTSNISDPDPKPDPNPSQPEPAPVLTHTRAIGVIHPPPDIRAIVEKTAQFVAKNGPEFERRILSTNAGNPKFKFLIPSDPFHAFYQHRISEHKTQIENGTVPTDTGSTFAEPGSEPGKTEPGKANEEFRVLEPKKVLVPPPVEEFTVRLPEGITGEELDIVKLTAQFVARNGKGFMERLMKRAEVGLPQFHFLRPTHSMYTFFTSLADAYSKVLMPEKGIVGKLKEGSKGLTVVLERCLNRLEWEKSQEEERLRAEDEIEQERMQMAMIDWHDFIVVETIEFNEDEDEELPMPMSLEEVIRRSKMPVLEETDNNLPMEINVEPAKEMEMEMDEEEMQLVEEGMRAAKLDTSSTEPTGDEQPMRIVKNWKRPEERIPAERDPTRFVISPITGELIPINEMAEHMRISLIDPKYKEQKDRMMAKIKETTLAQDDEISRNIVGLARTRPDIFGTTEEEVSNAVKAEIEKKKEEPAKQIIWDGHSGSIGRTATQALSQNGDELNNSNTTGHPSNLPGPAAPPTRPVIPTLRPLPPPPGLPLNLPRFPPPPPQLLRPPQMLPPPVPGQPPQPGMMMPPQPGMMMQGRGGVPMPPGAYPVPAPPGQQQRPFMNVGMGGGPPVGAYPVPAPPPPEERPPLPEEPEPKRQRVDEAPLIPEEQFVSQHPGPACILVSVPSTDEGNLKGQTLEISVQSLLETVSSLKEKIAGDLQLPANKQKISAKAGFLKDNLTLAYYNIAPGETLSLSLRERGGRKK